MKTKVLDYAYQPTLNLRWVIRVERIDDTPNGFHDHRHSPVLQQWWVSALSDRSTGLNPPGVWRDVPLQTESI